MGLFRLRSVAFASLASIVGASETTMQLSSAEFPDHCLTSAPSGIFIATCVINLASQQVSLEPVGTSGWRLHFASGGCLDAFSSVAVPCVSAPVMTLGSSSLFQVHSESLDTCLTAPSGGRIPIKFEECEWDQRNQYWMVFAPSVIQPDSATVQARPLPQLPLRTANPPAYRQPPSATTATGSPASLAPFAPQAPPLTRSTGSPTPVRRLKKVKASPANQGKLINKSNNNNNKKKKKKKKIKKKKPKTRETLSPTRKSTVRLTRRPTARPTRPAVAATVPQPSAPSRVQCGPETPLCDCLPERCANANWGWSTTTMACSEGKDTDAYERLPCEEAAVAAVESTQDMDLYDSKDSSYAFDQTALRSYNLVIRPPEWSHLNSHILDEEYVNCSITTEYGTPQAYTLFGAGCRYKGSIGSLRFCLDPSDPTQLSGDCRKLSFKVDSDKFYQPPPDKQNKKQRLFGLKKMLFHGMPVDYALFSERTAYTAFNSVAGSFASRATHARLFINGIYDGVYAMVEEVDDRFTKSRFGSDDNGGDGALYKDVFPKSTDASFYSDHLKEGKNEDFFMAEVARALAGATVATAATVLDKYFYLDSFANVIAINALIGQTDDWRLRHNFFVYVHQSGQGTGKIVKKLVLIPWDYDRINDQTILSYGLPPAPQPFVERGGLALTATAANSAPIWQAAVDAATSYAAANTPWHDASSFTRTSSACNPSATTTAAAPAFYVSQFPPDWAVPIQCDKFTKLLAVALKTKVCQRTIDLADAVMSPAQLTSWWSDWQQQLEPALQSDPDAPSAETWASARYALFSHMAIATDNALRDAIVCK